MSLTIKDVDYMAELVAKGVDLPSQRAVDVLAHLRVLLELLDAVDLLEKNTDFSRLVYDARDRELQGWRGPKVTAVSTATLAITAVLKLAGRR